MPEWVEERSTQGRLRLRGCQRAQGGRCLLPEVRDRVVQRLRERGHGAPVAETAEAGRSLDPHLPGGVTTQRLHQAWHGTAEAQLPDRQRARFAHLPVLVVERPQQRRQDDVGGREAQRADRGAPDHSVRIGHQRCDGLQRRLVSKVGEHPERGHADVGRGIAKGIQRRPQRWREPQLAQAVEDGGLRRGSRRGEPLEEEPRRSRLSKLRERDRGGRPDLHVLVLETVQEGRHGCGIGAALERAHRLEAHAGIGVPGTPEEGREIAFVGQVGGLQQRDPPDRRVRVHEEGFEHRELG